MQKNDIFELLVEELGRFDINPSIELDPRTIATITFDELMLDSLVMLELSMNLEEKLEIELEISEFPQDATIDEFSTYLLSLKK